MKILFVDHVCHRKTRSADFFLDLLREDHDVVMHYYERYYNCCLSSEQVAAADVVVFWEFLPGRYQIGIPGKRCVFVPMYDNEWGSKWQWRRLAMLGMNVVSFCRKVTAHAKRCGVRNLLDVCFAFDPAKYSGMSGDKRKVILWERGDVSFGAVKAMFDASQVDKVILVRREEEGVAYEPISEQDRLAYHVEIKGGGFIPEAEYRQMLSEAGVYIAPRFKEGIGMSFLEQMAMGKCVIAHDEPTMNEYIKSGKNGLLMDLRHPRRVLDEEIAEVRKNVLQSAAELYRGWREDENRIRDFFSGVEALAPLASPWSVRSVVAYGFYLIEGVCERTCKR